VNLIYFLDLFNKQQQNTKTMTHLLQFEKIKPTSSYDSVSYKFESEINGKIVRAYVEKNPWKPRKYHFSYYFNGKVFNSYGDYTSAKKAMIDCQICVNDKINGFKYF
jgi:hypothetical protein